MIVNDCWQKRITKGAKKAATLKLIEKLDKSSSNWVAAVDVIQKISS